VKNVGRLVAAAACFSVFLFFHSASNTYDRAQRSPSAPATITAGTVPLVTATAGLPPPSTPGATNPAVTQANIHRTATSPGTICVSGWTATIRPPASYTSELKRLQMGSGGAIRAPSGRVYQVVGLHLPGAPSDYEEDHRDALEIGGDPENPANLWPEIWNGPAGARAKDLIENRVHADVCSGLLTLAQGQAIFLGDWWKAALP
jgi:hypothetical protein